MLRLDRSQSEIYIIDIEEPLLTLDYHAELFFSLKNDEKGKNHKRVP